MAPYTYNPGHELAGRYRIVELLGVGRTAEVYLAEDLSLSRTVVVKVLLADPVLVPVIAPVEELSDNPPGSPPFGRDQVQPVPHPAAARV